MAKPKPKTSSDPTSDLCPYELEDFMEKHGLPNDAAGVILHTNGPSRAPCDYAAEAFLRFKTFLLTYEPLEPVEGIVPVTVEIETAHDDTSQSRAGSGTTT